ncbi:MAG: hypothetical protein AAFN30_17345 [Actinomycetota bacterium]
MRTEGHDDNTNTIPLGLVRLRVGSEHHRCMADRVVTLVPVTDDGRGYPWWIGPNDVAGIELEPGTAYVLDVAIAADGGPGNGRRYELVDVVEMAVTRSSAIAS